MSGYFETLTRALSLAGVHRPAMVLDTARLARNLSALKQALPKGYRVRIADKSLPAPCLLESAFAGLGAQAVMSFHLPITRAVLARFPNTSVLMGKPMPVQEVARFLDDELRAGQVAWLVDSLPRLAAYRALAEQRGLKLRVAFEVDIGLGRGGLAEPEDLAQALGACGPLQPVGVMGYEAHVNAMPGLLGRGAKAADAARARLAAFKALLPEGAAEIVNTGGSTTVLDLPEGGPANDLTVGSLIVKPSDFDQPQNADIEPALWIVSPVLKTHPHGLPGHPQLSRLLRKTGMIAPEIAFIYGGKWMAAPIWPAGLKQSPFFGPSSNQQGFTYRGDAPEAVVLRPTQSEAVIQQFPELWQFDGAQITGREKPFPIL
ncbi:alanine racemase [Pseudoruegeria sp. SHC-113]|uniref:alanine racemase n=1 Tax=Pseudoruegeria sp. SHC-113 TaxID=2855439 RepID=UPI0021BAD906|nr:alanine racemase [Pseudoruegeria sp. SHC-113]MCT8158788.1 alanine racemase [Pseudoruegeria sp. SHC-113]